MIIARQHDSTVIDELVGYEAVHMWGAGPGGSRGYCAIYLHAADTWYRFFINYGILFWATTTPDSDDDLADGEVYGDIFTECGVQSPRVIACIEMCDYVLTLRFTSGAVIRIKEEGDTSFMHCVC